MYVIRGNIIAKTCCEVFPFCFLSKKIYGYCDLIGVEIFKAML